MNSYLGIVGRRECVKSLGLIRALNSLLFNYGTVYVMEGNLLKVQTSYTYTPTAQIMYTAPKLESVSNGIR
jgi:hypothetical protein